VVEAMDPLPRGSRDDDGRIREEEARGFARVVVQKFSAYFNLTRWTEQRFYEDPAASREGRAERKVVEAPSAPSNPPPPSEPPPSFVPPPPPATLPPPPTEAPPEPKGN
jgi:hypothetical protein